MKRIWWLVLLAALSCEGLSTGTSRDTDLKLQPKIIHRFQPSKRTGTRSMYRTLQRILPSEAPYLPYLLVCLRTAKAFCDSTIGPLTSLSIWNANRAIIQTSATPLLYYILMYQDKSLGKYIGNIYFLIVGYVINLVTRTRQVIKDQYTIASQAQVGCLLVGLAILSIQQLGSVLRDAGRLRLGSALTYLLKEDMGKRGTKMLLFCFVDLAALSLHNLWGFATDVAQQASEAGLLQMEVPDVSVYNRLAFNGLRFLTQCTFVLHVFHVFPQHRSALQLLVGQLMESFSTVRGNLAELEHHKKEVMMKQGLQDVDRTVEEWKEKLEAKGGLTCVICREDIEDDQPIKVTSCGHYFHQDCIYGWIKSNEECPVCGTSLLPAPATD